MGKSTTYFCIWKVGEAVFPVDGNIFLKAFHA